jgi:hypothetical protein
MKKWESRGSGNHVVIYVTAVAGILGGDRNQFGVTGIVPRAIFSASSWAREASAAAIKAAADKLPAGDLILLEGNRYRAKSVLIPIEWWPDDLAAIQYAVAKGIIVVKAVPKTWMIRSITSQMPGSHPGGKIPST